MKRREEIESLLLLFLVSSVIGWIWEVVENLIANGTFANRGLLHGPWLPIYGTGMLLIYYLKQHFDQNPVVLFGVNCIAFAIIEFGASWLLEKFFHARWWDYTYEFMNLQGRICLKYVILFSVAGCFAAYYLLPLLFGIFHNMNQSLKKWLCIVLTGLFLIDVIYSLLHPNTGEYIANTVMKYLSIPKSKQFPSLYLLLPFLF